jgi:hypothetical protein
VFAISLVSDAINKIGMESGITKIETKKDFWLEIAPQNAAMKLITRLAGVDNSRKFIKPIPNNIKKTDPKRIVGKQNKAHPAMILEAIKTSRLGKKIIICSKFPFSISLFKKSAKEKIMENRKIIQIIVVVKSSFCSRDIWLKMP